MATILSQKIVREYVRILGGTFRKDDYGDLIVRFGEETYHTDSLDDAIGTARCMKGSHSNIEQAESYLALELSQRQPRANMRVSLSEVELLKKALSEHIARNQHFATEDSSSLMSRFNSIIRELNGVTQY